VIRVSKDAQAHGYIIEELRELTVIELSTDAFLRVQRAQRAYCPVVMQLSVMHA
jgi:hypothetical protein